MRALVASVLLAGCSPFGGAEPCTPPAWTTELWLDDARTGRIEAMVRASCEFSFPDAQTDYRIIGRRPGGDWQLLLEGSIEHFDWRHAVTTLDDGTSEVAVWDTSCRPAGNGFFCAQTNLRFP